MQAEISGRLPEWLQGAYVRNGPGSYKNGTPQGMAHWFDGYGCLVKMEVNGSNNTVTASHRFLESKAYQAFKTDGKMKWREFATAVPTEGWVAKAVDVATMALGSMGIMQGVTDNASVNVLQQVKDKESV